MTPDRFVILHHLAPSGEHWDFMLERVDCLWTWQMMTEPTGPAACPIECVRIKDHRKMYLDYEGPVSGGRGMVSRVDWGRYVVLADDEAGWNVRLRGVRMTGDYRLVRQSDSESAWVLVRE